MMQDLNRYERVGLRCKTQPLQFGGEEVRIRSFRGDKKIGAKDAKK
jgi:hypothetical protein